MNITVGEIVMWLIVGLAAGSLAAMLITRRKKGFGYLTNLVIGLVGGVIGGFLFRFLNISLGLGTLAVSIDQVISAFAGSLVFIAVVSFVRRRG